MSLCDADVRDAERAILKLHHRERRLMGSIRRSLAALKRARASMARARRDYEKAVEAVRRDSDRGAE